MASKPMKHLNNFFQKLFSCLREKECPMLSRGKKWMAKADRNKLIIAYKLLFDILFLSLLFFTLALIAEGALPGIVSAHIGLAKIVIFVFLLLIAVHFMEEIISRKDISIIQKKKNKKTVLTLLFLTILLIINSQLRINMALDLFISAVTFAIGYFVYRVISEE